MRFYNTLNKKVEEFIPIEENKVKLYTCSDITKLDFNRLFIILTSFLTFPSI